MKYRIKDNKMREAAITLFGDLAKEFDYGPDITAVKVSFAPLYSINNELPGIFNPLTNKLEIEPVKELAEGWNPYPETKPERAGKYLIALKRNDGDRDLDYVDAADFAGASFSAFHSDIIAWKEMPKIWKEE